MPLAMPSTSSPWRPRHQNRLMACSPDRPSRTIASRMRSAMPIPATNPARKETSMANPRRACAEDNDALLGERYTRRARSCDDAPEHDRPGPLHVVVERADLISVALENAPRVAGAEILPVEERVGEARGRRLHVGIDKGVVALAAYPCVAGAH